MHRAALRRLHRQRLQLPLGLLQPLLGSGHQRDVAAGCDEQARQAEPDARRAARDEHVVARQALLLAGRAAHGFARAGYQAMIDAMGVGSAMLKGGECGRRLGAVLALRGDEHGVKCS
jgi:hypothetical protein